MSFVSDESGCRAKFIRGELENASYLYNFYGQDSTIDNNNTVREVQPRQAQAGEKKEDAVASQAEEVLGLHIN